MIQPLATSLSVKGFTFNYNNFHNTRFPIPPTFNLMLISHFKYNSLKSPPPNKPIQNLSNHQKDIVNNRKVEQQWKYDSIDWISKEFTSNRQIFHLYEESVTRMTFDLNPFWRKIFQKKSFIFYLWSSLLSGIGYVSNKGI